MKNWMFLVHWHCQREQLLLHLLFHWITTISPDMEAGKLIKMLFYFTLSLLMINENLRTCLGCMQDCMGQWTRFWLFSSLILFSSFRSYIPNMPLLFNSRPGKYLVRLNKMKHCNSWLDYSRLELCPDLRYSEAWTNVPGVTFRSHPFISYYFTFY